MKVEAGASEEALEKATAAIAAGEAKVAEAARAKAKVDAPYRDPSKWPLHGLCIQIRSGKGVNASRLLGELVTNTKSLESGTATKFIPNDGFGKYEVKMSDDKTALVGADMVKEKTSNAKEKVPARTKLTELALAFALRGTFRLRLQPVPSSQRQLPTNYPPPLSPHLRTNTHTRTSCREDRRAGQAHPRHCDVGGNPKEYHPSWSTHSQQSQHQRRASPGFIFQGLTRDF